MMYVSPSAINQPRPDFIQYYSGNLPLYYQHLQQAAYLVRMIVGGNAVDLPTLTGEQNLDVRIFSWCDILSSMALSRPTLLNYEPSVDAAPRRDLIISYTAGLEEVFGCPDALVAVIARISTLRHTQLSHIEKMMQAGDIEQQIRSWQSRPVRAKHPVLGVARLGVQEIWRHAIILYLQQVRMKQ
jgi:hypothetical protein